MPNLDEKQLQTNLTTPHAVLLASMLFFPTLFFGNEYFALLISFVVLALFRKDCLHLAQQFKQHPFSKQSLAFFWLPLAIISCSLVNKLVNGHPIFCLKDYYAPFMLLPLVLVTARFIHSPKLFQWFVLLVGIEVLFGIAEYLFNTRSFFMGTSEEFQIYSKALLYDSRVFGLSANSSIFGLKLLVAALFIEYAGFKIGLRWFMRMLLLIGIIISFNRAVIVGLLFFWFATWLQLIWVNRKEIKKIHLYSLFQFLSIILLTIVIFQGPLRYQFSRGGSEENLFYDEGDKQLTYADFNLSCSEQHALILKEGDELDTTGSVSKLFLTATNGINTSGRKLIWMNFGDFLDQHLWFGNGSDKLMFKTINQRERKLVMMHAHNSFLELLGTNGVLISCLYLLFYLVIWSRKNTVLVLAILAYSMLQYGVFWGFSLLDVIFVFILIAPVNLVPLGNSSTRT